ncbi:DNA repair protein RecO [Lusitaniella coriacea LEGE 07157]|uniref:DNA repair protein RecO n=1 Tax=Lusitaniella coriacea LEGE 07157 TaxID=945747 RepID=A0A8J7DZ11_9CYAN|nr:DNA repair protein RecO [Lusitaniella coriacea]MBE9118176.1 DNA repair protein RecO [Lusitaniella coriacea LEGE 07157]
MSRTYKATGINLKSMPLGEADRLVTILTPEWGLIRAVAPGSRKPKSQLRGRIELFVVNDLLIAKGKSLDKIIQAETQQSYPGLSRNLGKLTASQYLAEVVLGLALSEQPQIELYDLFNEHLRRLEQLSCAANLQASAVPILSHIAHGVFHLLAIAGIAPQVHRCCLSGKSLAPNLSDPHWRVQFTVEVGGIIGENNPDNLRPSPTRVLTQPQLKRSLSGIELALLQQLTAAELHPESQELPGTLQSQTSLDAPWSTVEKLLRSYAQYHLGKSIRSAILMDSLLMTDL